MNPLLIVLLDDPSLLATEAFINGEWRAAASRFSVTNPATGELVAEVADHTRESAEASITAARAALPEWRYLPASIRSELLYRWAQLMLQHQQDLSRIMTIEQGKPLAESQAEIAYSASYLRWFAGEAERIYGDTIPSSGSDKRLLVLKQPVGVVAAITPWNFPSSMITRKAAPALAAGCTFSVKPAAEAPLSATALAVLAARAGIPAGVF